MPENVPDVALLNALRDTLMSTLRTLDDGLPYALLDFPSYSNIGDSVIWLGARHALLQTTGRAPAYVSSIDTHDDAQLNADLPKGTIYLLGGGNFGDLWPRHQRFREGIAARYGHLRIVQLPQSISFSAPEGLTRARQIIRQHPNFVLLVRDHRSVGRSQDLESTTTLLAPDLAFALGARTRHGLPEVPILALLRSDHETSAGSAEILRAGATITTDWTDCDAVDVWLRSAQRLLTRPRAWHWLPAAARLAICDAVARRRVSMGERLLSRAALVRTDRLHGHIMCVLLGIPHEVADNNDGKIRTYIETWTHAAQTLRHVSWAS